MKAKLLLLSIILVPVLYNTKANALEIPTTNTVTWDVKSEVVLPQLVEQPKKVETKVEKPKQQTQKVVTYKVQQGDTLTSIADKFHTTWKRLWDKNTNLHNQDVIHPGDVVKIPLPKEKLKDRGIVNNSPSYATSTNYSSSVSKRIDNSSGNAYGWGQCTWYVKNMKPGIGNYWGNAGYSWISNAAASGYMVSSVPVPGSIGVQPGHVVIITGVNSDGTVSLSEMNYAGGLGVVHYDKRSVSSFIGFIYA